MNLFGWFKKKKSILQSLQDNQWQSPFAPDEDGWIPIRPSLEVWKGHQFIPNESLFSTTSGDVSQFSLQAGYIPGTLTGEVYVNNIVVQTFVSAQNGHIYFEPVEKISNKIHRSIEDEFIPSADQLSGTISARCLNDLSYIRDNILILKWNDYVIDDSHIVVSYEVRQSEEG